MESGGSAARGCVEHGLAAGPDGLCMLCRRELAKSAARRVWAGFGAMAAVVLAGLVVFSVVRARPAPVAVIAAEPGGSAALAAAVAEPEPGPAPRGGAATGQPRAQAPRRSAAAASSGAGASKPEAGDDAETQARHRAIDERARAEAVEAARKRVQITVYTTSWCPHCTRAKRWLSASGLPYQEVDVEKSEAGKRKVRELNPSGSVPTIDIEGEVLRGFSEASVRAAIDRAAQKRARL